MLYLNELSYLQANLIHKLLTGLQQSNIDNTLHVC